MRTLGIFFLVLGLVSFVAGLIFFVINRKQAARKSIEEGREEIDRHVGVPSTIEATSPEFRSEERS